VRDWTVIQSDKKINGLFEYCQGKDSSFEKSNYIELEINLLISRNIP